MSTRTLMSFFLDDVGPYSGAGSGDGGGPLAVDAQALLDFLGYVRDAGIAGAVSVIPGMFGLLSRSENPHERRFAAALGRLAEYREYIGNTIAAGRELGVHYAGLTTPGTSGSRKREATRKDAKRMSSGRPHVTVHVRLRGRQRPDLQ